MTGGTAETGEGPDVRVDPRVVRTRSKVLGAAHELLLELGFHDITIEDISVRSGVSRSTMYRHWTTREEILRDAFSSAAVPAAPSDGDTVATLRDDLRHYARVFADGLEHAWGRAAATMAVTAMDDPAQAATMATFVDGYTADVETMLDRARRRGELRSTASAREVADRLVGPLFYRFLFRRDAFDDDFLATQADVAWAAARTAPPDDRPAG